MNTKWHPTQRFTGAMIPRFDKVPGGPMMQSMVYCICGRWWKDHRFGDGACPLPENNDEKKD